MESHSTLKGSEPNSNSKRLVVRGYRKALRICTYLLLKHLLRVEYETQHSGHDPNERRHGYPFALKALLLSPDWDVLDVGTGRSPWPAVLAACGYRTTAIDEISKYWHHSYLFHNHHFYVIKDDITAPRLNKKFGAITCLSTLQHIREHTKAIAGMAGLLKPAGILVLWFPYNEERYVPDVYALPEASYGKDSAYICQVLNRAALDCWIKETGLELVYQQYYRVFTGKLWACGERLQPTYEVTVNQPHHLTGVILRKRA